MGREKNIWGGDDPRDDSSVGNSSSDPRLKPAVVITLDQGMMSDAKHEVKAHNSTSCAFLQT